MIDRDTVEQLGSLARLALTHEQADRLVEELGRILEHADRLAELDLTDVPRFDHAGTAGVFRLDVPGPLLDRETALENAPDRCDGFFRVPRVIEDA